MKHLLLWPLLATSTFLPAAIELPAFFSDGMVLQREGNARIWGWLDGKGKVSVTFAGKTETSTTSEEGKWEVVFKGLQASAEARELTITDGTEEKVIQNVVVGEVWIASGQSNMEWTVAKSANAKKEIASSEDTLLRVYLTNNVAQAEEQIDFPGGWASASPQVTGKMTAVGYYFARDLREKLQVPVGIIECSWGGKPVEAFMSEEALQALPEGKQFLERKRKAIASYDQDAEQKKYEAAMEKWEAREKKGRKPRQPVDPQLNSSLASTIYNGMIAPIAGYAARGAIWYQGESNAKVPEAGDYGEMLAGLVADWRQRWDSPLSFYYVQLANYKRTRDDSTERPWITVQDEMRRALQDIDKSGMAVINDIGHPTNIHPTNKQDVGARLARWALAQDYGFEDIVKSGPLFKEAAAKDGTMVVSFDYNVGIKSRDGGPLQWFELKGKDGAWVKAIATVEGQDVLVSSEQITEPVAVRYAWAEVPEGANLVNEAGLPASCFTSEVAE